MVNIKEESFFMRKIFKEGFGLPGYFRYLKNKFGDTLSSLPGYNCTSRPNYNFELHILCCKKDLRILVWSLVSFLYYSELCPRIFVHDDGSVSKNSAGILESKFPNLKVIFRSDADKIIRNQPGLSNELLEHRKGGHKLILKLVDIFLLSSGEKIMVLDSDILFFKKPAEIVNFIKGHLPFDSLILPQDGTYDLMVNSSYAQKYDLEGKRTGFMNSGLMVFNRKALGLGNLLEYFESTYRKPGDYFVEMAGWGCLIAQTNFRFLPINKYHIKGRPGEDTIMKHFTNPRRHELYVYGIDMVKSKIKN